MDMITLFSGLALKDVLDADILPSFIGETGLTVDRTYEPTAILFDLIRQGSEPDVIIGVTSALHEMERCGFVEPGTIRGLVRSNVGLAVSRDAQRMPIATVQDFIEILRDAKSIAFSNSGASGAVFQRVASQLELSELVQEKAVLLEKGFTAEAVRDGRAEVAVQQISELATVPEVRIVGPLPASLNAYVELSIASGAMAKSGPDADRLIKFLTSNDRSAAFAKNHLEQMR